MSKFLILIAMALLLGACTKFMGTSDGDGPGQQSLPCQAGSTGLCTVCGTQLTLTWTAPTTNTDGSALTDLAGFNIYYGTSAGAYGTQVNVPSPTIATKILTDLPANTYYFVMTAYGLSNGAVSESAYSNSIGVELQACTAATVNAQTGKVEYAYLPPKIIDTKVEPFKK